jgi:hypothetical protein
VAIYLNRPDDFGPADASIADEVQCYLGVFAVDEMVDDYQQPLPLPVDIWRIISESYKKGRRLAPG